MTGSKLLKWRMISVCLKGVLSRLDSVSKFSARGFVTGVLQKLLGTHDFVTRLATCQQRLASCQICGKYVWISHSSHLARCLLSELLNKKEGSNISWATVTSTEKNNFTWSTVLHLAMPNPICTGHLPGIIRWVTTCSQFTALSPYPSMLRGCWCRASWY